MRLVIVLSLGLCACGPVVGVGEDDSGSAESTSTATQTASDGAAESTGHATGPSMDGSSGEAPTVCTGECIEPPGLPWRGPLSIATVEEPGSVSCPAAYPQSIATFGHVLINKDLPCECQCSPPSAGNCSAALSVHAVPGCDGDPMVGTVDNGCTEVGRGASLELGPPAHDDMCEAWTQPANSDFDLHTVLCEGELLPTCEGGGSCAPAPGLDGLVCWWAPGEEQCPPGLPERLVVYSATDDHRTCAEGCGCEGTPTCTGGVIAHDMCDEPPPEDAPVLLPGECLDLAGPVALDSDFAIEGECTPTVPNVPVMGEIFEDAPQTLCCTGV